MLCSTGRIANIDTNLIGDHFFGPEMHGTNTNASNQSGDVDNHSDDGYAARRIVQEHSMPSYFSVATRARASISLRIWFAAYRSYKRIYHPFVDLGIRLSIAQFFLKPAMVQAMTWHEYLAGDNFSRSWLNPQHAALL